MYWRLSIHLLIEKSINQLDGLRLRFTPKQSVLLPQYNQKCTGKKLSRHRIMCSRIMEPLKQCLVPISNRVVWRITIKHCWITTVSVDCSSPLSSANDSLYYYLIANLIWISACILCLARSTVPTEIHKLSSRRSPGNAAVVVPTVIVIGMC